MTHLDLLLAFVFVGLALLVGKVLRLIFPVLAYLFLPSSILGGAVVLLLGPQVLGAWMSWGLTDNHPITGGLIPNNVLVVWRGLPGMLINIVFAALLLGRPLPNISEIWRRAGSQVVFGQTLAWGQYVVGITLGVLVLTPVFGLPPMAGALIEIAYEGGHGTAAGMAETFRALGFDAGADLAMALATVGLVAGVVAGTILVNWAARRDLLPQATTSVISVQDTEMNADQTEDLKDLVWEREQTMKPTDPYSIQLAIVGLAIAIGWGFRELFFLVESVLWVRHGGMQILHYMPLFPMAMLGGVAIQVFVDRTGLGHHINRRMMNRISGSALDFTIVAALGTLSLAAIRVHWAPFLLLATAGLAWNLFAVLVLAPRLMPEYWFPRAVCDFGQSTGVTVTGLLLLRMADPTNESGTLESFGYKQLLFEPFVGGGVITAASVPLLAKVSPVLLLGITASVLVFWLVAGWFLFGRFCKNKA